MVFNGEAFNCGCFILDETHTLIAAHCTDGWNPWVDVSICKFFFGGHQSFTAQLIPLLWSALCAKAWVDRHACLRFISGATPTDIFDDQHGSWSSLLSYFSSVSGVRSFISQKNDIIKKNYTYLAFFPNLTLNSNRLNNQRQQKQYEDFWLSPEIGSEFPDVSKTVWIFWSSAGCSINQSG